MSTSRARFLCISRSVHNTLLLFRAQDTMGWGENDRGVSFTFGAEVVAKFLHKHDFDLICRAHQVSQHRTTVLWCYMRLLSVLLLLLQYIPFLDVIWRICIHTLHCNFICNSWCFDSYDIFKNLLRVLMFREERFTRWLWNNMQTVFYFIKIFFFPLLSHKRLH